MENFFIPLYETLYKIILFIILIFEISSSNFLGVVLPIILDETWKIKNNIPCIWDNFIYNFNNNSLLYSKKNQSNKDNKKYRINSINTQQELFLNKNTYKSTKEY